MRFDSQRVYTKRVEIAKRVIYKPMPRYEPQALELRRDDFHAEVRLCIGGARRVACTRQGTSAVHLLHILTCYTPFGAHNAAAQRAQGGAQMHRHAV